MTIGIHTRYYLKRLALLCGVVAFLVVSATLVDRALAQSGNVQQQQAPSNGEHVLSIHDRGEERVVITRAKTVREALSLAGISVSEQHDIVEPALGDELVAQRYNVNIYRARPVTVVDGIIKKSVTTAEQTPERIADVAGVELYAEDEVSYTVAEDLVAYGAGQVMSIDRATLVDFTFYGKKSAIRTKAETVGDFLKEKDITMGASDFLSVPKNQAITEGMSIELWRDGKQTVTVEEEVDFEIEQIKDANRDVSHKEIKTAGEKGLRNVTYDIEMKNGQEVGRTEVASVVSKEPKKQVEIVGTKPKAMPYTGGGNKDTWLAASNIPQDQWGYAEWLVQRESTWNPNAVNRSSGACGLAQALPCSKVPGNPYDPVNSLNWMNGYVVNRYGSWAGAVAHSQAKGWY